jgi:hypothetical protein
VNGGYLSSLENDVMASWRRKSKNTLYRTDPEAWLSDFLGYRWHNKQRELAEKFLNNRRSATKSANGTGKTRIFGELAVWGQATHEPGELFIIATAPGALQLKDGLFAYVDKNINLARQRGHEVIGYVTDAPAWSFRPTPQSKAKTLMRGRTPPRQNIVGTFQGIRAIADKDVSTWVFCDEGGAVHDDLYTAMAAVTTGAGNNKQAVIGNPDMIGTYFQKIFENKEVTQNWATTTISALDLPTFTGEIVYDDPEKQREMLESGMIDPEWVEAAKRAWGEDSARYRSKVLGEFPDADDYSFFSMTCINLAENVVVRPDGEGTRILGVDLADSPGIGDDSKAYLNVEGEIIPDEDEPSPEVPERGSRIRHQETWQDGAQSANRIHELALRTEAAVVSIDQLGVGAGPFNQVCARADRFYTAVGVKGSWKSPDPSRWANYRAYMYDIFREDMLAGRIDLDYSDEVPGTGQKVGQDLRDQLLSIRYDFDSKGAILIEPKKEMRKRGVRSPDDLDAVIYSHRRIVQPVVDDPIGGMNQGDTVLMDPYELEGMTLAGMPI